MSLSVQNKNFLAVLNKLDIDVKQFPDKTFDGLFDNIPKDVNYFFNWFIENISPDNALTCVEQALYFQLESTQSLPKEEEINLTLSSCDPSYEKLMSLNTNYSNFLSQNLDDLRKYHLELSEILTAIKTNHNDILKKQNNVKEEINARKRLLETIKQDCRRMNLSFGCTIDKVKMFLLEDSHYRLDLNLFKTLVAEEENIFCNFNNIKSLESDIFSWTIPNSLPKLKEDLACVEISMVISEGLLLEKKAKIDFLMELLQKKPSEKSLSYNFMQSSFASDEEIIVKMREEINNLETELFNKIKMRSDNEVQKISDHYLLEKTDLKNSYITELSRCKKFMMSNRKMNSYLLHILLRCISAVESEIDLKKWLCSKLIECETSFSNDITNFELRKQRYKEVSAHQSQYPLLIDLKSVINLEDSTADSEEALRNVMELIWYANDDSNFVTYEFKNHLQSSIKALFDKELCGPTNQLLFVPVELLIKFQKCEERENELSQKIKRLANKYVDAKETISKSDRKRLLLWIDFLTNSQALSSEVIDPLSS